MFLSVYGTSVIEEVYISMEGLLKFATEIDVHGESCWNYATRLV